MVRQSSAEDGEALEARVHQLARIAPLLEALLGVVAPQPLSQSSDDATAWIAALAATLAHTAAETTVETHTAS